MRVCFGTPSEDERRELCRWLELTSGCGLPEAEAKRLVGALARLPRRSRQVFALCYQQDALVAAALWRFEPRRQAVEVWALLVAPELRGRGLGTHLLERLFDVWRVLGVRSVRAWAEVDRVEAVWFYLRHGFSPLRVAWRRLDPELRRMRMLLLEVSP